jgi:hypothetical protein
MALILAKVNLVSKDFIMVVVVHWAGEALGGIILLMPENQAKQPLGAELHYDRLCHSLFGREDVCHLQQVVHG